MNKIKFWYRSNDIKDLVNFPSPAKQSIPDWYKKAEKYFDGKNEIYVSERGVPNVGLKSCIPFLDSLISGYFITLHCDVLVKKNSDGSSNFSWAHGLSPIVPRNEKMMEQLPSIDGFSSFNQGWENFFRFTLPKGYSALITHPINHFDLPFISTSGIIDGPVVDGGAMPFCISNIFEGIIPEGTPIAQIIPFKRDDWKTEIAKDSEYLKPWNPRIKLSGWYRDNIWKKKNFD
jgi:hypothetical protein